MFLLIKLIYNQISEMDKSFYRDARTTHLPLVGSPVPMIIILAMYLFIVIKLGPNWMENRKPINVKLPMQLYNIMQVVLNMYIFWGSFRLTFLEPSYNLTCQPYDTLDMREQNMKFLYPAWAYCVSKYLDLFDTIFFVLRKKSNQVSFLHVYHHTAMVFAVWVYMTYAFASHLTVTGVINSFIHVCMYTYYFLTSLQVKLNVSWKKRLTQLQILQFLYLTIHLAMPIIRNSCDLDMFWIWIAFVQNFFMLLLFSDFYVRAYMTKERRKLNTAMESEFQKIK